MILKKFECEKCTAIYDLERDAQLCCAIAEVVQYCSLCEEVFYVKARAEEHEEANACEVTND